MSQNKVEISSDSKLNSILSLNDCIMRIIGNEPVKNRKEEVKEEEEEEEEEGEGRQDYELIKFDTRKSRETITTALGHSLEDNEKSELLCIYQQLKKAAEEVAKAESKLMLESKSDKKLFKIKINKLRNKLYDMEKFMEKHGIKWPPILQFQDFIKKVEWQKVSLLNNIDIFYGSAPILIHNSDVGQPDTAPKDWINDECLDIKKNLIMVGYNEKRKNDTCDKNQSFHDVKLLEGQKSVVNNKVQLVNEEFQQKRMITFLEGLLTFTGWLWCAKRQKPKKFVDDYQLTKKLAMLKPRVVGEVEINLTKDPIYIREKKIKLRLSIVNYHQHQRGIKRHKLNEFDDFFITNAYHEWLRDSYSCDKRSVRKHFENRAIKALKTIYKDTENDKYFSPEGSTGSDISLPSCDAMKNIKNILTKTVNQLALYLSEPSTKLSELKRMKNFLLKIKGLKKLWQFVEPNLDEMYRALHTEITHILYKQMVKLDRRYELSESCLDIKVKNPPEFHRDNLLIIYWKLIKVLYNAKCALNKQRKATIKIQTQEVKNCVDIYYKTEHDLPEAYKQRMSLIRKRIALKKPEHRPQFSKSETIEEYHRITKLRQNYFHVPNVRAYMKTGFIPEYYRSTVKNLQKNNILDQDIKQLAFSMTMKLPGQEEDEFFKKQTQKKYYCPREMSDSTDESDDEPNKLVNGEFASYLNPQKYERYNKLSQLYTINPLLFWVKQKKAEVSQVKDDDDSCIKFDDPHYLKVDEDADFSIQTLQNLKAIFMKAASAGKLTLTQSSQPEGEVEEKPLKIKKFKKQRKCKKLKKIHELTLPYERIMLCRFQVPSDEHVTDKEKLTGIDLVIDKYVKISKILRKTWRHCQRKFLRNFLLKHNYLLDENKYENKMDYGLFKSNKMFHTTDMVLHRIIKLLKETSEQYFKETSQKIRHKFTKSDESTDTDEEILRILKKKTYKALNWKYFKENFINEYIKLKDFLLPKRNLLIDPNQCDDKHEINDLRQYLFNDLLQRVPREPPTCPPEVKMKLQLESVEEEEEQEQEEGEEEVEEENVNEEEFEESTSMFKPRIEQKTVDYGEDGLFIDERKEVHNVEGSAEEKEEEEPEEAVDNEEQQLAEEEDGQVFEDDFGSASADVSYDNEAQEEN